MVESTLKRTCTVTDPAEFDSAARLGGRLLPYPASPASSPTSCAAMAPRRMVETTSWQTAGDCRAYLRNGAAAMAATWLDAFFPTAPFPDGNWLRETVERP
jgi:hypothetical protein